MVFQWKLISVIALRRKEKSYALVNHWAACVLMGYCNAERRDKGTHGAYEGKKTFKESSVFYSCWSSLKYDPIVRLAAGIYLFT